MDRYLKNAWYAALWSKEVEDGLSSAVICDSRVLIFRKLDGNVTAMEDRCPHRFAPLSLGHREGDAVICGYHGLKFAADGKCVHNPFSEAIPAGAKLRVFPVAEKDTIVWLWMGDPASADPSLIPDFSFLNGAKCSRGRTKMKAHYEVITDNLLDLSHLEFLHANTFGGDGVIFQGQHEVIEEGQTVHSNWWMPNVGIPKWAVTMFPAGSKVNHWLNMRWDAPASLRLEVGVSPLEAPQRRGDFQAHILTPETGASTHYMFAFETQNETVDDTGGDAFEQEDDSRRDAFELEDKVMLEAVQANMGNTDFWSNKPLLLSVDAGAIRARRVLSKLIDAEIAGATSGPGSVGGERAGHLQGA